MVDEQNIGAGDKEFSWTKNSRQLFEKIDATLKILNQGAFSTARKHFPDLEENELVGILLQVAEQDDLVQASQREKDNIYTLAKDVVQAASQKESTERMLAQITSLVRYATLIHLEGLWRDNPIDPLVMRHKADFNKWFKQVEGEWGQYEGMLPYAHALKAIAEMKNMDIFEGRDPADLAMYFLESPASSEHKRVM